MLNRHLIAGALALALPFAPLAARAPAAHHATPAAVYPHGMVSAADPRAAPGAGQTARACATSDSTSNAALQAALRKVPRPPM